MAGEAYMGPSKRTLVHDIGVLAAVAIFTLCLQTGWITGPNRRGFFKDDPTIGFPYTEHETVTVAQLVVIAFLSPVIILTALAIFVDKSFQSRPRIYFFVLQIASFALFTLTTMLTTDTIKLLAGRLRPDFLARCQPDYTLAGVKVDPATGYVAEPWVCTGDPKRVAEGRKSFPSGHSSIAMFGMGFLALVVQARLRNFHPYSHLLRPVLIGLCLTTGLLVAASRYWDNRHHPGDILLGGLIGLAYAYLASTVPVFTPPWASVAAPGIFGDNANAFKAGDVPDSSAPYLQALLHPGEGSLDSLSALRPTYSAPPIASSSSSSSSVHPVFPASSPVAAGAGEIGLPVATASTSASHASVAARPLFGDPSSGSDPSGLSSAEQKDAQALSGAVLRSLAGSHAAGHATAHGHAGSNANGPNSKDPENGSGHSSNSSSSARR